MADQGDRGGPQGPGWLEPNAGTDIGRVVAVMSGKGGVGKSSVSALLAVGLRRAGRTVGVLDADITGPSIPRLFGLRERPPATGRGLLPVQTGTGVAVMSLNLLLAREDDPVIWRGPLIAGAVRQFWTDVAWGRRDCLVVDLPPGTGDAPLTVLQSLPVDGVVIVSSPQELVGMVVRKAINLARKLEAPLLGLVENMSHLECPHCGGRVHPFGPSRAREVAAAGNIPLLGVLPIDPRLAELGDAGRIEEYEAAAVAELVAGLNLQGE